jgi:hypothetical protein
VEWLRGIEAMEKADAHDDFECTIAVAMTASREILRGVDDDIMMMMVVMASIELDWIELN